MIQQEKFNFFSSRAWKVILISGLGGLAVFFNPYRVFDPVHRFLSFGTYPFQKAAYQTSAYFRSGKDFLSSLGSAKRENERLTEENLKLASLAAKLVETENENRMLREQLELRPREKFDPEGAFVISRDPHGLGNWIEIDKGEQQGIKEGMAVVVSDGVLVGKIGKVFAEHSQVLLTTSPESVINSLDARTGAKGVVRGEYELGGIFDMVLQGDILNVGDEIVSAGSGGGFPQGLLIGKVEKVGLSPGGLFQQAILSLPVKFSQLKVVFVLK